MFHFTLPLKGCILIQNSQDTFSYESKKFLAEMENPMNTTINKTRHGVPCGEMQFQSQNTALRAMQRYHTPLSGLCAV